MADIDILYMMCIFDVNDAYIVIAGSIPVVFSSVFCKFAYLMAEYLVILSNRSCLKCWVTNYAQHKFSPIFY